MKLFFLIMFLFLTQNVIGQVSDQINETPLLTYDYFKVATNKKAAKICLKGGLGLMAVGGIVALAGLANEESSATPIGVGMFLLGTTATLVSIPLFIMSGNNERSVILALKTESIHYGLNNNFYSQVLSFNIPLN